jgi:pSer/pThr/pTyr-binding forkhead associated (FHA) protein
MNDVTLIVLGSSAFAGRRFRIGAGQNLIGREPGAAVQFYDDLVSRRHAMVTRTGDDMVIEDLGSANGTWVNEELLVGRRPLRPGDVVRVGGLDALVADDGTQVTRLMTPVPAQGVPYGPGRAVDPAADTRRDVPRRTGPAPAPRHPTFALSPQGLTLNAVGSGVTALALSALHVPEVGTILGPALAAVVTAFVQTGGRRQWLRIVAAAGAAYFIAAAGITLPEIAIGRALANEDSPSTYLPEQINAHREPTTTEPTAPPPTPPESSGTGTPAEGLPGIEAQPSAVDCGEVAVGDRAACAEITVSSTGDAPLEVSEVDVENGEEFTVFADDCFGRAFATGEGCVIVVEFAPVEEGERTTGIVIHQNIPLPDQGTPVAVTGTGLEPPVIG